MCRQPKPRPQPFSLSPSSASAHLPLLQAEAGLVHNGRQQGVEERGRPAGWQGGTTGANRLGPALGQLWLHAQACPVRPHAPLRLAPAAAGCSREAQRLRHAGDAGDDAGGDSQQHG